MRLGAALVALLPITAALRLAPDLCAKLQKRVDVCNDMGDFPLLPLLVDGARVGSVRPPLADALVDAGDAFVIEDGAVQFAPPLRTASEAARTAAVAPVVRELADRGVVTGWRDELLPVTRAYDAAPAFLVERAAYPLLGAKGYGVHINGFVRDGADVLLWVATRARTKQTYPGLLDHIAAGQLATGDPGENVKRESQEEAGVPEALAAAARPVSVVSYRGVGGEGKGERVTNDVIFCYDLELPADFRPRAVDGEVESFDLWKVEDVIEALVAEPPRWKPNVAVVTIDFLVRRGVLQPELPGYLPLVASLRQGDCS
mmetsp:Transcript_14024/g.41790  ORF Transcript_14024/g.41790 Transcript_14024/m.41790 type:complete len:316 (-) Transcript_14024:23-970(-)